MIGADKPPASGGARKRADLKHIAKSISDVRSLMNKLSLETKTNAVGSNVFMDMTINGIPQKRIRFKLNYDAVPLTAENFRQLCTGEKVFTVNLQQYYATFSYLTYFIGIWVQKQSYSSNC